MEFLLYILNLIREGNPEGLSVLLILVIMLSLYIIVRLYTAKYITGMTNDSRICIAVLIVVLVFVTLYRPHHNYEGLHSRESLQLRKEIEQLTARYKDAEETISNLSANYAIKTKENTQLQNKISELSTRPAAIILSGDKESAERIQQLTSENSRLTKEIEHLNAKYQDAMNENKRLSDELAENLLKYNIANETISQLTQEAAQLRQDNTRINNEVMSLHFKENKSAEKIQQLTSENFQLNERYDEAVKNNEKFAYEVAENLLKYNEADKIISQLTKNIMTLSSDYYSLLDEKGSLEKETVQLRQDKARLAADYRNASEIIECFFYVGGNAEDYYLKAHEKLKSKADSGYIEAQFYLGYMLDPYNPNNDYIRKLCKKLKQDPQEAKHYYKMAALGGHVMSSFFLANIYYIEKDYMHAAEFYKRAADSGDTYAQYLLGYMHGAGLVSDTIDTSKYSPRFNEGMKEGIAGK